MIFSRDFVTRKNSFANHLVTKISLFTVTHALFFISPLYRHLCLQLRVPYAPILNTTRSLSLSLTTLLEKKILGVSTRCCIFVHHGVVFVVFHGGSVLTHCSVGHYECDIGANLTTLLDISACQRPLSFDTGYLHSVSGANTHAYSALWQCI